MLEDRLLSESEHKTLQERLNEAEETLTAIRSGAVDAVLVTGNRGPQVFTLQSADHPYRIMVEAMNEGAVTITADGCILYSNPRFSEMVSVPTTQLLGRSIQEFISDECRAEFAHLLSYALSRASRLELMIDANDHAPLPVVVSLSPLPIDATRAICAIFTNITDKKARAKAEMNEQKYRALAQELEKAQDKLQEKINDLETFYDVAVDRELRMIELEKQLQSLPTKSVQPKGS